MRKIGIKLLIVEDDKVDQMAYRRLMNENPDMFDSTFAGSLKEAKTLLEAYTFEIIVTDYWLGDGIGLELIGIGGDTPVIVVTGSGDEEVAVKALRAGAYDYLIKDVDRNYIKIFPVTVENVLKQKQAEAVLKKKERLQGVVETAGAACHELNQPLQAISGYAELLLMELEEGSSSYEMAQEIKRESVRMGNITRNLNSITRYETIDYVEGRKIIDLERASSTISE